MAYVLILLANLLFSSTFLFQRNYTKNEGYTLGASMLRFSVQSVVQIAVTLISGGSFLNFSTTALFLAAVYAFFSITNTYCAAKVFAIADMSVFSVFNMLGGMVLPFIAGVFFFGEDMTHGKWISFLLIVLAVFCELERKKKSSPKALAYYFGLFFSNGVFGVLSKCNQEYGIDSDSFLLWVAMCSIVYCILFFLISRLRGEVSRFNKPVASIAYASGGGVLNVIANVLLLVALRTVDASVQYPLVTGGTIVFSALMGLTVHERPSAKGWVAVALSVLASVLIIM